MWEIVRAGGPVMWPIILCSVIAGAIVFERLWKLPDLSLINICTCRRAIQGRTRGFVEYSKTTQQ